MNKWKTVAALLVAVSLVASAPAVAHDKNYNFGIALTAKSASSPICGGRVYRVFEDLAENQLARTVFYFLEEELWVETAEGHFAPNLTAEPFLYVEFDQPEDTINHVHFLGKEYEGESIIGLFPTPCDAAREYLKIKKSQLEL